MLKLIRIQQVGDLTRVSFDIHQDDLPPVKGWLDRIESEQYFKHPNMVAAHQNKRTLTCLSWLLHKLIGT